MALIIIPLAGPDFITSKYGIRPLMPYNNTTLIDFVLSGRPWLRPGWDKENKLVFILRDVGEETRIMRQHLLKNYPPAEIIVLASVTAGAPFSAIAGISMLSNCDESIIIDLADIAFSADFNFQKYFDDNHSVGAVLPVFKSDNPGFSYIKLDGVSAIECSENQVISPNASAGVYIFRDFAAYISSFNYGLNNAQLTSINSTYYFTPMINGLLRAGVEAHGLSVRNVISFSTLFHE